MSFINNVRRALSIALAPKEVGHIVNHTGEKVTSLTYSQRPREVVRESQPVVLKGELTLSQLKMLHSQKVLGSICNYGAWEALARAFSAYCAMHRTRVVNPKMAQMLALQLDRFHAFNAELDSLGMGGMDEVAVEEVVARLTVVKPVKENAATDAILARVKHMSVEEVRKEREGRQQKEEARRAELMNAFLAEVWSATLTDEDVTLDAQKAYGKAVSCLEWMANWDNPDMAEILLAEADVKLLERMAVKAGRIEDAAGESSREIDEALLDAAGMRDGGHK